jgi:hypothetical protein
LRSERDIRLDAEYPMRIGLPVTTKIRAEPVAFGIVWPSGDAGKANVAIRRQETILQNRVARRIDR